MSESQATACETFVEIDAVSKTFGSKTALSEVTWSVRKGRISGLLGPNGAGKTTLFRLLMGILKATSGRISPDTVARASPWCWVN